jgi:hypothetical protein
MDAKLNSETHLQQQNFRYVEPFPFAFAINFSKITSYDIQFFPLTKFNMSIKNRDSGFEPIEKV